MAKKTRKSGQSDQDAPLKTPDLEANAAVDPAEPSADAPAAEVKVETKQPLLPRAGARSVALVILAIGVLISAYLTYGHLQLTHGTKAFESLCNISETINCDTVNTSDQSELFGLPLALFAIPTYVVLGFLFLASFRSRKSGAQPLAWALGISLLTVVHSAYLAYVALVQIKAVCLFCISLYAVNLASFGLAWYASQRSFKENLSACFSSFGQEVSLAGKAALVLGVTFVLSLAGEQAIKGQLLAGTQAKLDQGGRASSGGGPVVDDSDAVFGPPNAKVVVVEYADFQCGYCKRQSYALKSLKEEFGDRVLFAFKHFPMSPKCNDAVKNDRHPYACEAAKAGICANRQGRFWEFHDITFKNQRNLKREDLETYAGLAALDLPAFQQCMSDPTVKEELQEDIEASKPFQITGTPRTYINGKELRGIVPLEVMRTEILKALKEAGQSTEPTAGKPVSKMEADVLPVDAASVPTAQKLVLGGKSFLIDAFEASQGPKGEASSLPAQKPWNKVSWYDAKDACAAAGKRLCTQEEWLLACQGTAPKDDNGNGNFADDLVEGREFAYSDFYAASACNDSQEDAVGGKLALTGSFARCHTPENLFDLNGNVQEWVGASEDSAVLMGAAWYAKEKASCFAFNDTFGPGFTNRTTGFRCCQDAP